MSKASKNLEAPEISILLEELPIDNNDLTDVETDEEEMDVSLDQAKNFDVLFDGALEGKGIIINTFDRK